jgi:hypothetical protein
MAETEENRWSLKVLRYLGDNKFRVTWGSGEATTEPSEMLENVAQEILERARRLAPFPVIVSCSFIKKCGENSFTAWLSPRETISNLQANQFPLCEGELAKINHSKKSPLVGRTPTEHLERMPPSAASFESVSGGCFQHSMSNFLEIHGISSVPLETKLGKNTYVDLREVQELSDKEDWPFRLSRIVKRTEETSGHYLKITSDHCEYVTSTNKSYDSEFWRLFIIKKTRKRMRSWE